jgi:hypothetical protein
MKRVCIPTIVLCGDTGSASWTTDSYDGETTDETAITDSGPGSPVFDAWDPSAALSYEIRAARASMTEDQIMIRNIE